MQSLLTFQATDPDEQRRGRLFQIFLIGVIIPMIGLLIINSYQVVIGVNPTAREFALQDGFVLAVLVGLWLLHRHRPKFARRTFLVLTALGTVLVFGEQELDRDLIVVTFPILMASFLGKPTSSFVYAGIVIVTYVLRISISSVLGAGEIPLYESINYLSMVSAMGIALVAWVVSNSLDQALAQARQRAEELRILNEELDQRVQTRTQQLAEALEREHAAAVRNQTILESIGDGVLVTNEDKQIIIANPAANRLAQRNVKDEALSSALTGIQSKALVEIEEQLTLTEDDEQPNIQFEWNDRTIAANISAVVLDAPGHQQISRGNVMVLRDVTREAEIDRMKTVFLGAVSHELRTPLASIRGYVEFLLETAKAKFAGEEFNYLQIIDTNIKRLTALANDLIDLSRIEVGELALYRDWAELESILRITADTVKPEFDKRQLSLDMHIEPDLPLLYVDRNRIIQAMLNLLTNAYKYTVEGGATVNAYCNGNTVQIDISDTGIGMTEEDQKHMFSRFYRAHNELVRKSGGSGLGLAITKNLIELHDGTITFESRPNEGTTFSITLPILQDKIEIQQPEVIAS